MATKKTTNKAVKKTTKKKVSDCGCLKKIDALLAKRDQRLILPLRFKKDTGPLRALVAAEQRGGARHKPVYVQANFCPFCGLEYGTK
ncbi:MAG TPA: hypothetical protein VF905_03955 [Nitrospirota bacterium]